MLYLDIMVKSKDTLCKKEKEITILEINQNNMAQDLKDIKSDIKEMKETLTQINEHILTAPQKFTQKEHFETKVKDYDDFKNNINIKIAFIS